MCAEIITTRFLKGEREMKLDKIFEIAYLVIGVLVVLEFMLVRGQFTWLIAAGAIGICGLVNMLLSMKNADFMKAALYVLCTVGLCMGYLILA